MYRIVTVIAALALLVSGVGAASAATDTPPPATGHLTGRVVDVDGHPRARVLVVALAESGGVINEAARAATDDAGRYDLGALSTGGYRLRAGNRDNIFDQTFQATYSGDTESYTTATVVAAEDGTSREVPDIATPLNGFISGRVVDEAGRPIGGLVVGLLRFGDDLGFRYGSEDTTDAFGRWKLARRDSGDYQLQVRDPAETYRNGYFDGTTTIDDASSPLERRARVAVSASVSPVVTITVRPRPPRMFYGTLVTAAGPRSPSTPTLVGETVTFVPGPLTPTTARVERITWTRDFVPVPGAEGASYTVRTQDAGRLLGVVVELSSLGATARQDVIGLTAVAGPRFDDLSVRPEAYAISDPTPVVGQVLRAVSGNRVVGQQWYRDGRPVGGSTGTSYTVTKKDLGSRISLQSQLPRTSMPTAVRTGATRAVRRAAPVLRLTARAGRDGRVTLDVRGSAQGLRRAALDGRLRISRVRGGSDVVRTVTMTDGRRRVTLTGQPAGRRTYYVSMPGVRDRMTAATSRKVTVTVR